MSCIIDQTEHILSKERKNGNILKIFSFLENYFSNSRNRLRGRNPANSSKNKWMEIFGKKGGNQVFLF